jgi:sugar/nucleoside kinase (ribokinase family)
MIGPDGAITCAGDLMVEHIALRDVMPDEDTTVVLEASTSSIGGSALNIGQYLRRFGWAPRIVAPYGRGDRDKVVSELHRLGLSADELLEIDGPTDALVCVVAGSHHRSFYLRSDVGTVEAKAFSLRCHVQTPLVLCGSRHRAIRAAFVDLACADTGRTLIFSPSYTIFEYSADELTQLLRHVQLAAFNEQEAEYASRILGLRDAEELGASTPGLLIVTRGHRGAYIKGDNLNIEVPSVASSTRVAVGAGDAFLSGFVFEWLRGRSPGMAAKFAATLAAFVVESDQVRVNVSESTVRLRMKESGCDVETDS